MRIVFMATGGFAVASLRALCGGAHQICRVVSQPDRAAGRGRHIEKSVIHAAADELALAHIQTPNVNELAIADAFENAEIGVVIDFGQKIGAEILRRLPCGCINIHGSLLPAYRGAAPIQRAIMSGDDETGVTCFQLNEQWDAGGIYGIRKTKIGDSETADELHDRLALLGSDLLLATLADIENNRAQPQMQDASRASRAPKLSRAESFVRFDQPARALARQINGLWSWPGATCTFVSRSGKSERLLLARAAPASDSDAAANISPGSFLPDRTVQTPTGRLQLLEVQPAGGKRMSFDAFANGRRIAPPDRLEPLSPP